MGDAVDFFEWVALADMYHEISQRLAAVEQANHECSRAPSHTRMRH